MSTSAIIWDVSFCNCTLCYNKGHAVYYNSGLHILMCFTLYPKGGLLELLSYRVISVRAVIMLYHVRRPVRDTITLYPIGRPVRATTRQMLVASWGEPDVVQNPQGYSNPSSWFISNQHAHVCSHATVE